MTALIAPVVIAAVLCAIYMLCAAITGYSNHK